MRLSLLLITCLSTTALADSIRTSDGISCSFDADDSPFKIETYTEKDLSDYHGRDYETDQRESRVGFKLTYSFGGPSRLDCDKLYQIELRAKEARVKQLEQQIKAMELLLRPNGNTVFKYLSASLNIHTSTKRTETKEVFQSNYSLIAKCLFILQEIELFQIKENVL